MPAQSISQQPDPLNLTLRQNQEWAINFSYQESDGTPISLAGYTPLLQFRTSALAKTTVLSIAEGTGITFDPTDTPQVQINTGVFCPPGKYEWDLKCTPESGEAIYLGQGIVIVDAEVSRNG